MKILLLTVAVSLTTLSFAQTSSVSMRETFSEFKKFGHIQGGESLQNYSDNNIKGSRYFPNTWETGSVTTTNGETMSNYLVLFDKQNQDVYVKEKDKSEIVLLDKDQLQQFSIDGHNFISGAKISGEPTAYYEQVAGKDDKVALYKLTTTKFIKADRQDPERIKAGDFSDEYRDEITYFIKRSNQPLQKIKLTRNNLLKALPEESKEVQSFLNAHANDGIDERVMRDLINNLNS